MSKLNIEAEGGELILQNENGDYSIIPKKDAARIKMYIKKGLHNRIDNYVSKLPLASQYAEDGTIITDPGDGFWKGLWQGIKDSMKVNNKTLQIRPSVFTPDYSKEKDFDSAYAKAKTQGNKEFTYSGKKYNTTYKGTKEEEMAAYGILPKQATSNPSIIRRNLGMLNTEQGYDTEFKELKETALGKTGTLPANDDGIEEKNEFAFLGNEFKDNDYFIETAGKPQEQDAFRLYLGLPQRGNTFRPSKYKEGAYELTGYSDKFPDEMPDDEYINKWGKPKDFQEVMIDPMASDKITGKEKMRLLDIQKRLWELEEETGGIGTDSEEWKTLKAEEMKLDGKTSFTGIKPYSDYVMGKHTVRKKADEEGEYLEYIDRWDLDKVPGVDQINKPYDIYGRIYYKDYGDGKKRKVHYTDSQLKKIDTKARNFNTFELQKELTNRGYKLPNSIKRDGTFDGIWGEETEAALKDWKQKNK